MFISLILEVMASIDLYYDVQVFLIIFRAGWIWSACLMMMFMISPYLISYVPLINYQIAS